MTTKYFRNNAINVLFTAFFMKILEAYIISVFNCQIKKSMKLHTFSLQNVHKMRKFFE